MRGPDATETQGKQKGQVLGLPRPLRLLLLTVALLTLWVTPQVAQASVGMCADSAQSIEAPPPLYPSDGTTLQNCDHFDLKSGVQDAPLPDGSKRLSAPIDVAPEMGILPVAVLVSPARSLLIELPRADAPELLEHRGTVLRPPCLDTTSASRLQ